VLAIVETQKILDALDNLERTYKNNAERINLIETETCDILHIIELYQHDAVSLVKLASALKKIRMERRQLKEENELLEIVCRLFENNGFAHIKDKLSRAKGQIEKKREVQKQRQYAPRIRLDLEPGNIKEKNNLVKFKKVMERKNAI